MDDEYSPDFVRNISETFEGVSALPRQGQAYRGQLVTTPFGAGRAVLIGDSNAQLSVHRKVRRRDASSDTFNLLVFLTGFAESRHCAQSAKLRSGDLLLIDGASDFHLDVGPACKQIMFQFPRDIVGRRHHNLFRSTGSRLSAEDPRTRLIVQTASTVASQLPLLDQIGRGHAFDAMVSLLGLLSSKGKDTSASDNRFTQALADIDANLSDPTLCPDMIAALQAVSRRRLDAIFAERGLSMEQCIWDRRLDRAAAELQNTRNAKRRLIEVAIAWGFSSQAHFSRRFRARFGLTPTGYRSAVIGRNADANSGSILPRAE